MNPPQRRQVVRITPGRSRAGSSSQSCGSVWLKQRVGFLAASNSAAVGLLGSVAGPCPVVGVPVGPASAVLVIPAAVPTVGGGEPAPASRPVEVLPAAVGSAGAGRVQSRRRSASNPAPSGVAVLVPGTGAAGPKVRVPTVPAAPGLFVLAAVEPILGRCVGCPAASAASVPSRPGGAQVERVGVEPAAGVPSGVASVAPVGAPAGVPVEVSVRSLAASVATAAPAPVEVSASGRWDCKLVSPGEPAAVPAVCVPAGAATVPRLEVPAVAFPLMPAREPAGPSPTSTVVLRGVPVNVSAIPSGFPGGRFVLAVGAVSGPVVVMAACSLSVFRVPCAAQGTRLWSLSGKGDTHATHSVREMPPSKGTPTPPTS